MPDFIQELNYNFWTSLTRRGCVGNIKQCFKNNKTIKLEHMDSIFFWQSFDRTDTGACLALQTLPFMLQTYDDRYRKDSGPVFLSCKSLQYLACEKKGRRSDIVDETKLQVKKTIIIFQENN